MLEIQKSKKARTDLKDIWKYSFDEWGETQADRYYDKLEEAMNKIARTPKLGKPKEGIRLGLRGFSHRPACYLLSNPHHPYFSSPYPT